MRRREYHWSLYHAKENNQLDGLRTDQVEVVYAAIPKAQHKEWFIWKESAPSWKPLEDFPMLLASLRKADDRTWETPPIPDTGVKKVDSARGIGITRTGATKSSTSSSGTKSSAASSVTGLGRKSGIVSGTKSPITNSGVKSSGKIEQNGKQVFAMSESDEVEFSLLRGEVGEDRHNVRFQRTIPVRIVAGSQVFENITVDISLKGMSLKSPLPASLPNYYTVEIEHDEKVISLVCSTIASLDGSASRRVRIEANEYSNALFTFLLSGAS